MRTTKETNKKKMRVGAHDCAQKGITLIALVITIIVMLILVAVTINMAVNGGLFDYAGKATGETKNAIANEQELANLESGLTVDQLIDKYTNAQGGTDSGVIAVPETYAYMFDVGETAGTVTAYLVENGTSAEGETLYDMLIIGTGAMSNPSEWETDVVDVSEASSEIVVSYNVNIKNVRISEGVTNIASSAFYKCTSLESVTIPEGVTYIGDYAFSDCTSLASVTIPEGLEYIGYLAFHKCDNLTRMILPMSLTNIFYCWLGFPDTQLPAVTIYYRGTQEQWDSLVSDNGWTGTSYEDLTINYEYNG